MKQTLITGCILILGACSTTPPKPDPAVLTSTLDTLFRTAVEQKKVPGTVAIVLAGDKVVYDAATSMNKDTIFAIASMTKPVTSVAIMQLVEAGKVKLDEPAFTYVPDLAKVQVLDNGKLRAPRNPITVRHLLTHTAGFSYEFMSPEIFDLVKKGKLRSMLAGGDAFLDAPLLFDPGQRWEYGINTDWLGRLVEKVSGRKLDEYFRVNIFDPLAMPDSYFQVPGEKKTRIAKRYQRKDGTLAEQQVMPPWRGNLPERRRRSLLHGCRLYEVDESDTQWRRVRWKTHSQIRNHRAYGAEPHWRIEHPSIPKPGTGICDG